jgi:hypothetical protein
MALEKDQLKHDKKRKHLIVGGVVVPTFSFWGGGYYNQNGLTMATQGEEAHESAQTEASENESGETSATTSGSAAAGGDASAGGGAGSAM